jgi:hypothetical protein
MSFPRVLWLFLIVLAASACGQNIGDACESALDCSSQGSRLCDQTQPNGYCTIRGCEKGTCPDNSVCVKFRPAQERLAVTYCMYECDEDSDCRNDEGYQCARASDFGTSGGSGTAPALRGGASFGEAEILGNSSQRFCAAKPKTPVDAGAPMMSMPAEPSESADSGSASDAGSNASDASSNASDASSARDAANGDAIDGG